MSSSRNGLTSEARIRARRPPPNCRSHTNTVDVTLERFACARGRAYRCRTAPTAIGGRRALEQGSIWPGAPGLHVRLQLPAHAMGLEPVSQAAYRYDSEGALADHAEHVRIATALAAEDGWLAVDWHPECAEIFMRSADLVIWFDGPRALDSPREYATPEPGSCRGRRTRNLAQVASSAARRDRGPSKPARFRPQRPRQRPGSRGALRTDGHVRFLRQTAPRHERNAGRGPQIGRPNR